MDDTSSKKFSWSEWKRPLIAVTLSFFCNVESSMVSMGEWPYMTTIDHDVTSVFYGYSTAAYKASHATFAFLFAIWAHKISVNRRWWMLVCYLLFGVGFGTSPLLRSYIARVTTEENRSTGYALQNGGIVLSVVVGPIAQIAFAGLPYPGIEIIPPHIKLNIYTAPIWFSLITNLIAIAITFFLLEDTKDDIEEEKIHRTSSKISFASIKERILNIRTLNIPWILVVLVIFEKMVSCLFNSTMFAIIGPMMSSMYALSGQQIALIMAVAQMIVGFFALVLSVIFFVCNLGKRISCRVLFIFSNFLMIASYLITYPFPFMSDPMQPFNETTRTGCNPEEYSWCDTQLVVNIVPYIIILIITSSFAVPSSLLSLDTIYSKIIGDIDQNVMQSVFIIAEDIITIACPIYGTAVFTAIGINFIHIINGSIYIFATVLWIVAWRWLTPYK